MNTIIDDGNNDDDSYVSLNSLFFQELKKLTNGAGAGAGSGIGGGVETDMDVDEDEDAPSKTCYITNEPLDPDTKIILECKHEFNYEPLYHEVKQQKLGHNSYRRKHLGPNQIRCPYCRHVQNKILPYHPSVPGIEKIRTINYPTNLSMTRQKCSYIIKSGKNKGLQCGTPCYFGMCTKHMVAENKRVQAQACIPVKFDSTEKKSIEELMKFKIPDLKKLAKQLGGEKYSKLNKKDLVAFIHSLY